MVGEGRGYAAAYMRHVAARHHGATTPCHEAEAHFQRASDTVGKGMWNVLGGFCFEEATVRRFAEPEVRKQIVALIHEAANHEAQAMAVVRKIVASLPE